MFYTNSQDKKLASKLISQSLQTNSEGMYSPLGPDELENNCSATTHEAEQEGYHIRYMVYIKPYLAKLL